jgi:hypothetical protein
MDILPDIPVLAGLSNAKAGHGTRIVQGLLQRYSHATIT